MVGVALVTLTTLPTAVVVTAGSARLAGLPALATSPFVGGHGGDPIVVVPEGIPPAPPSSRAARESTGPMAGAAPVPERTAERSRRPTPQASAGRPGERSGPPKIIESSPTPSAGSCPDMVMSPCPTATPSPPPVPQPSAVPTPTAVPRRPGLPWWADLLYLGSH